MPVELDSPFRLQTPVHPRYGSTTKPAATGTGGFAATLAAASAGSPPAADPTAMTTAAGTPAADATASDGQGGPDPSFMDPHERTVAFTRRDWKPQADSKDFHPFGDDGFTIDDVVDVINPLQHIPVVSSVYRWLTGDTISPASELAGGALYGGVVGLASAAGTLMLDAVTGGAADQQVMVALLGPSPFADAPADTAAAPDLASTETAAPAATEIAQAPTSDAGMPASRGAGMASAAIEASAPDALQEIPEGLVETLSQAPNAARAPADAALPPAATAQPASSAQPQVIGAGSVTDSLPVVLPQTAAASARVTEAPSAAAAADPALQPARTLKPLPPPLPAGFTVRNPAPIDTQGLGRSLGPANLKPVDTANVPAAMSRALDSYRKMMQERSREAVPVPGLDFQS
jgi:hypothetical protein